MRMLLFPDPFEPLVSQLGAPRAFAPAADVISGDGDLVLTLDVPGLTSDDVSIELLDGYLVVSGERKRPELAEGASLAHRERAFGRFERRVKLPDGVNPDSITASLEHGVLSLIVPKPERPKPRTIAIGEQPKQLETANA